MGTATGRMRGLLHRLCFKQQELHRHSQQAQELHRHRQQAQEFDRHSPQVQQPPRHGQQEAQELHRHIQVRSFSSSPSLVLDQSPRFPYSRRSSSPLSEFERACSLILKRRPPSEPIEITLQKSLFPLTPPNLTLLFSLLRSPKDALRIFLIFLNANPSLAPETAHVNAVARFWVHEKERFPAFLAILQDLRKPNCMMTPRRLTAVIRGYGWAGLVEEVLAFLSTSKSSFGFHPDFFHFSCALHACIEEKRLDVALQIFRQMDENGCSPTFDTFQSLIAGLLNARQPKDAALLFVQLVSRRLLLPGELPPSVVSYITIVDALIESGDPHQALLLVVEMNDNDYVPDYITCSSILKAMSSTHIAHPEDIHPQDLKELYDVMNFKELLPNVTNFKDFVRAHCQGEMSSETQKIFNAMIRTFDFVTSLRVSEKGGPMETEKEVVTSIRLSENEGITDTEKEDVASRMASENERTMDTEKEVSENARTMDIERLGVESLRVSENEGTMDTEKELSENKRTMDTEKLVVESVRVSENEGTIDTEKEDVASFRVSENEGTMDTDEKDVASSSRASDNERTMDTEKELSESEGTMDTKKELSENEGTMDNEKKDVADLALFDHVIYSLGMNEKSADAYELMLRMTQNSGIPTINTSMVLFDALCRSSKWLEAEHVLRMMMKWDYTPNLKTYNFWIQGSCKAGHLDEVYHILNEFSGDDLVLDAMSFNVVVDKLCIAGKLEEAKKITAEVKKSVRSLDVVTYSRMIHSFAKAGNFEVPQRLLGEMVEMGLVPFAQPFTPLIDNLCKGGKMEEALALLDELEKKGCKPISSLYTYIIHGYCVKNRLPDAFKVIDTMKSKGVTPEVRAHKVLFEGCMVARKSKPAVQGQTS